MATIDHNPEAPEIVYGLESRPPFFIALLAGLQHLMAMFVGIITPPIIIARALDLPLPMTSYLISIALFISGIGTFMQVRRWGPIGSGLLSMQGVSFIFLGTVVATGLAAKEAGGSPEQIIATISGVGFLGAFVKIILSRMEKLMRTLFTTLVAGITVTLVGLSLVKVGMVDLCGGMLVRQNSPEDFASLESMGLGLMVLAIILVLNCCKNQVLRTSAILIALLTGYAVACVLGLVDFGKLSKLDWFSVPQPLRYGIAFDWNALIAMCVVYVLCTVEAVGDLAATSMLSGRPVSGPEYVSRLKGGVCCDGVASIISTLFNSTPVAIFAQNNAIIQITGVASRHVGNYIAVMLLIMGIFPVVGGVFALIPPPVLGGATVLLFGTVAAAGIKMIGTTHLDRRAMLIMGLSFGMGLGVEFVPEVSRHMPDILKDLLHSPVATGGMVAILANLLLPGGEKV